MNFLKKYTKSGFLGGLIFALLFAFSGCEDLIKPKISEGEIVYKLTYLGQEGNMMVAVMPTKMKFRFKNDKTISEFRAGMGLFYMSIITNASTKTLVQQVKVITEKKGITYHEEDLKRLLNEEPPIKIELKKGTKKIAGYKCKRATVVFPGKEREDFDIYYTNQIKIKEPNWYNQFKEIEGVVLEYRVKRWGIETKLEAISIEKKPIDEKIFNPSPEYRPVTQSEIDQIFENFN